MSIIHRQHMIAVAYLHHEEGDGHNDESNILEGLVHWICRSPHLAGTYEYASIFETKIRDRPLSSVLLEWLQKNTVA